MGHVLRVRYVSAPPEAGLINELSGCHSIFVVEQNQSGQLYQYLHAQQVLTATNFSHSRPGPLPMRPDEIVTVVKEQLS